jgi:LacI family transcriptional regulator
MLASKAKRNAGMTDPEQITDKRRRSATIHDVAEQAGVAVGTVSRYLNGQEVRRSNREQIEQAIEKLSFQRNAAARAMKAGQTDIIGFMVPAFDEFHAELLNYLARSFRQSGRTMLTYCHDGDPKLLRDAIGFFADQRVDALVMAGYVEAADEIRRLTARDVPVVIYNNDVIGLQVDRIMVENAKASYRAVRHLISVGHEKIAVIQGSLEESSGQERFRGFCDALSDCGIPLPSDYIHPGNWTVAGGYSAIEKFMSLAEPPTAVFSCNYQMTTGMLEWVREHGKKVPDDIAIVSFDDVELFRLYDGGITAIEQPIARIAETIADYVASRLTHQDLPDIRRRTLDCNILLRASSDYPAAARR